MGLSTFGDISVLQKQFEDIKAEIDKQFDRAILKLSLIHISEPTRPY